MEWVRRLRGAVVGLDTAPLIYFVEEHPVYLPLIDPFFEAMGRGEIQVVTSTLTLTEVLVYPYKHRDKGLAQQYWNILIDSRNLRTIPVSPDIAADAASLRAVYGLKTPDSIQLATARTAMATVFLTNDERLALAPVSGLEIVVLSRVSPHP